MAERRVIKSRKTTGVSNNVRREEKANAKSSLVNKVNTKTNPTRPSERAKSSLSSKARAREASQRYERVEPRMAENNQSKPTKKAPTKKKPSKKRKTGKLNFFSKLSIIGKIMFTIFIVLIVCFIILFANAFLKKGHVVYGSREEPVKMISTEQVNQVKKTVSEKVKADSISVTYDAYRLVVIMDLADSTTETDGYKANVQAYRAVNTVLPIKDYFSSTDKLNNDLFIYSTDVVPSNLDTNSKYIYETYKNSKMPKAASYNLLKYRDKRSYDEVVDSMKKAKRDGN